MRSKGFMAAKVYKILSRAVSRVSWLQDLEVCADGTLSKATDLLDIIHHPVF
jgi:hypothetical protein